MSSSLLKRLPRAPRGDGCREGRCVGGAFGGGRTAPELRETFGLVDGKPRAGLEPKDLGDSSREAGSCRGQERSEETTRWEMGRLRQG